MTSAEVSTQEWNCFDVLEGTDPFVQLALADGAVGDLARADLSVLGDEWISRYAASISEFEGTVHAVTARLAAEVQRRGHERSKGFHSAKAWLKHHMKLSGADARSRMQVVRLFALFPEWEQAALRGEVGVEQIELMARLAANPRVQEALTERSDDLLDDAAVLAFDEFERSVRGFERSSDPEGAKSAAEKNHEARDVKMKQNRDGSWRLTGRFGSLQGAEINEVLAHFNQAQWESDWAEARERFGDDASFADLRRIESQRRADALYAAMMAAASSPGPGKQPLPTLNVLIDAETLRVEIEGGAHDPARYRDITCRTQSGAEIDLSEAAALALWARIRAVVHDGARVVIEMGRRSRLFRGSPRDAAMLLHDRCIWPGCDRPVTFCQTDHSLGWKAHGCTVPRNGGPMCGAHNRLKDRGDFTARRLGDGTWLILDSAGEPVG